MAVEAARGCGYRKVGGLYLVGGGGIHVECDRLPYEIKNCPTCGSGIHFSRGFTWLDWRKYAGDHFEVCNCLGRIRPCPICRPSMYPQPYALIWIGDRFYTPEEYTRESFQMGVSRRLPTPAGKIPRGPKGLKLGETWVLCAHIRALGTRMVTDEGATVPHEENVPGVFYVFTPTALEFLLWKSEATPERLEELTKAGITPVVIPDGDKDHDPNTPLGLGDAEREALSNRMLFSELRRKIGK